jgi:hypothetical protein
MRRKDNISNADARVHSKRASRAADQRAFAAGTKTIAQLKRENEVFAPFAANARIDLSASRRLA